ncbi:hypothetical protein BGW80DRAFT_1393860 [Lactifluus volemus]|nr:hypothetical protein BGW80DRAFT_1393860 [Lactifluus volemus]
MNAERRRGGGGHSLSLSVVLYWLSSWFAFVASFWDVPRGWTKCAINEYFASFFSSHHISIILTTRTDSDDFVVVGNLACCPFSLPETHTS